jgi:hypothetical protein
MVLSSELLAGILEEVRPLLGQGRWPITFRPGPGARRPAGDRGLYR